MPHYLSTKQLADRLGMGSSTIRAASAAGTLHPAHKTPGGHARWVLEDVLAQLGGVEDTVRVAAAAGTMTGLTGGEFAPLGVHVIGEPLGRRLLPQDMVALGVREVEDEPGERYDATHRRWGGELVLPLQRLGA